MSNSINLNFINKSSDAYTSSAVFFQRNTTPNNNEHAIVWRVIKYIGIGNTYPFRHPLDFSINTTINGISVPTMEANHGQHWEVVPTDNGSYMMRLNGKHSNPEELVIVNNLQTETLDAHIYKDRKLLTTVQRISPQEYAKFSYRPTLHIAIVDQAEEGEPVKKHIEEGTDIELSLEGISSADIVMTGTAPQYTFTLENVKKA